jgi:uncharacterized protein YceH (UPF0502 family)
MALPALSLLETRVLCVLLEKQHTVPDSYPLTRVALTAGCNQKSSRDPVLDATETEVQAALDHLKRLSLVLETSGGRVMRYAHNFGRVLNVPPQATALLAMLMLRGPQTAGELRGNCERLHRFADISSVEAFLRELSERSAGALVTELPRQPGSREPRWAHLLCGAPASASEPASPAPPAPAAAAPPAATAASEIVTLRAELARVAAELEQTKAIVARLCEHLGIADK